MDIAVPLGIIINELVSNSLKYAFPGKDKGLIQIKLCRGKAIEYTDRGLGNGSDSGLGNGPGSRKESCNGTNFILTVSDNGIGIPDSFNSENSSSLGLQLVMILVDQLGGELELKRDYGTEFVIRFSVAERQ
jgi:two-component sensor histidine kinase